ncbi:adenosine deaminase [Mycobacteroides abscessus]|nr:adenosine deaminase [Mycobacteroides abscessus]
MSRTTMTQEMALLVEHAGWTIDDLADVTMTAAWSAFVHHDERRALVDDVILPGYQQIEGAQL